jgi:predicted Rossmann fold nucleotide-binding protein DprA/Smf involved in DNA uptake
VLAGAAFGIDQAAHRGALATGGGTVAVLPCGVDRAYPTAHTELLALIAREGLVISEAPPGAAPTRSRSLARNRILAGLGEGTLVVEAAARSGALNTAHWTCALGRPVLALPGPVTSTTSTGVHQLIRAGTASLVTSADDVVTDIDRHRATTPATPGTPGTGPGTPETHRPAPAPRQGRADRAADPQPGQPRAWLAGAEQRRAADPDPRPDTPASLRRRLTDPQATRPDPGPGGPRP